MYKIKNQIINKCSLDLFIIKYTYVYKNKYTKVNKTK